MTEPLLIRPVQRPIIGTIRPPGSKSITNRALVIAALAGGKSTLRGVLDSQDTHVMLDSLHRLGISVQHDPANQVAEVAGCGGRIPSSAADLWLENSGTSIRFLTAAVTLGTGSYRLDGNARMRQRPIADLVAGLRQLGADVECATDTGCPPVVVRGRGLAGGVARVAGDISSQYLSALLMAAPGAESPVELRMAGTLVSEPYVDMTIAMMRQFGVDVTVLRDGGLSYRIAPQRYQSRIYEIEPDASAASYFFAAAAVTGGEVTVPGLGRNALQGDVKFAEVLEQMGCAVTWRDDSITMRGGPLRGVDVDMNAISDTAQTLAAVAVFASGPTRFRNVAHIRHKETDRIGAVAAELRRLGQTVDEHDDGLTIVPAPVRPAVVQTYDDHRMAMSFAIVGLRAGGVQIADPGCTVKTYPHFFEDLNRLCQT